MRKVIPPGRPGDVLPGASGGEVGLTFLLFVLAAVALIISRLR